ncbi:SDR family NAD(P)-dependent oxidoreductase [Ruegeria arenilitoris]|uniref:SDR family NAD(P)-dependent oxidoreductase n=1 Tax=Ruegeria arenilitoris TaxID=1173585 RepID=UPI0014813550|nr:SDR family NAD(P)-dependent oxidoreductase [Ruegeria arenilitoris]
MQHEALKNGSVAVITGAASGIGLATAQALSKRGMHIVLVDLDTLRLEAAAATLHGPFLCQAMDVSDAGAMVVLADRCFSELGRVDLLMNNAADRVAGGTDDALDAWHRTMEVNFWAAVYAERAFLPRMLDQGRPGIILNTGSKQGITNPPGNVIYNVTKSALKTYTEQLQHKLRNSEECQVTAHLLVPGFTITGPHKPNPGGWSPEQLVDYMLPRLERGDFYIICPDNEVTEEMDAKRMAWAVGDLIENRPPLSRWHPDWCETFKAQ